MPNLADLDHTWSVLEARADEHPLPEWDGPAKRGAASPTHRRRPAIVLAAASVAALAVGAVALGERGPGHAAPAAGSAGPTVSLTSDAPVSSSVPPSHTASSDPSWTTLPTGHYLVVLDGLPGARFRSVIGVGTPETAMTDADRYQEVQFADADGGFVVKVNEPGSWQPAGGQPTTVDGRPASYGSFLLHPEIAGHPVPPRVALAWQYEPGAWATIGSTGQTPIPLATAQRIVGQLQIAVGDAIPSPPPQGS